MFLAFILGISVRQGHRKLIFSVQARTWAWLLSGCVLPSENCFNVINMFTSVNLSKKTVHLLRSYGYQRVE